MGIYNEAQTSMGNQQVTQAQLGWLAGLWDGEGTITIFEVKEAGKKTKLTPSVSVVNTNVDIINEADKLMQSMGVHMHLHRRERADNRHKDTWTLQTRKGTDIHRFLSTLCPHLIGKRSQCEMTLRYVEGRLKHEKHTHNGYTEDEEAMMNTVRSLNARGTSTTTRETVQETEDIVYSSVRADGN